MTLFCTGNSHLAAFRRGAEALGVPVAAFPLRDAEDKKSTDRRLELWQALVDAVEAHRPEQILCFIGGSTHVTMGLQQHAVPFDVVIPGHDGLPLDGEAALIPYAALRKAMEDRMRPHLRRLARLARLGVPVVQFECPPPIFDNEALQERAAHVIRKLGEEARPGFTISPPWLRYKLWLLQSQILEAFAEERGVAFVKNPKSALDERGFLHPDCWHDTVHGNAHYGALVVSSWVARQAG